MLDSAFQLSGALLTIYSIVSLSPKDIRETQLYEVPVAGNVSPKIKEKRKEKYYAVSGAIMISIGYILPTISVDVGVDMDWYLKLFMLVHAVSCLVLIMILLSDEFAEWKSKLDKPFDPKRDIFGITEEDK